MKDIIRIQIIEKYNPYHGKDGRFTSPGGATSFTFRSNDPLKQKTMDKAIEREKARSSSAPKAKVTEKLKEAFGEEHSSNIAKAIDNSPEFIQDLWNKYADNIDVEKGGYLAKKVDRYSKETDTQAAYQEIVTGCARFIDKAHNDGLLSESYGGGAFTKILRKETNAFIKNRMEKAGMTRAEAMEDIKTDLLSNSSKTYGDVGVFLEGVTKGRIFGPDKYGSYYWKDTKQYGTTIKGHDVSEVAFAHMFSAVVTNPQSVKQIKSMYPESYKMFEDMCKAMVQGTVNKSAMFSVEVVEKFNPNHDKRGKFSSGGASTGANGGFSISAKASQKISSKDTSINENKLPAVFSKVDWKPGTVNFDNGGGKFDNATKMLEGKGVKNLIYDRFNRSDAWNKDVIGQLNKAGLADTSTISNVLNVIAEKDSRLEVLNNSRNALKDGGKCYITVYEGNGSGVGKTTSKGYQLNKKTKDYLSEVQEVFPDAHVRNGMIIGTKVGHMTTQAEADRALGRDKVWSSGKVEKSDIMDIEVIEKFNPYHDRRGRFTSGGSASSVFIGDKGQHTQAAIRAELKAVAPNGIGVTKIDKKDLGQFPEIGDSIAKHLDENGNLTPEREALHQQIMANFLSGLQKADGQAEFIMMGGGPASGKSSTINEGKVTVPDKRTTATIDPDAIKTMLPEYKEMLAKGDPNAAGYVHEESSALAKRINSVAQKNGYNVLYDGTGDGSVKSVEKKLAEAKANGLKTRGIYVTCPTDNAVERAVARGKKTGRVVNESVIRDTHRKVSQILPEVAHQFDNGVELWDTTVKGNTRLVAKGGNGKGLTAVDQKLYNDFLAKASE